MGKPRKKSWSSNGDEMEGDSIFANNPFLEGLLDWMGSPEGQQHIELSDDLWVLLEDVQVDAKQRLLIWPDAERLTIDQSVQRILETGYDPEDYSQEQLDELDKLTERWVKDHERRPKLAKRR
jgi:ABC-type Fe3+ transport system substrate-binding protein